jgi:DNA (cytosine-5)-methyltransferase 1
MTTANGTSTNSRGYRFVGLFAGIGGIELGLSRSGHQPTLMVEIDESAQCVLEAKFPGTECPMRSDIRDVKSLPCTTEMLAAGFPCQDLSQAGQTNGIHGRQSGLIAEVFRLARQCNVPRLLLENVPFMLQLRSGEAMRHIIEELEELGYRWAYRIVDSRAFGLPQRRERMFLLASRIDDPSELLFQQAVEPDLPEYRAGVACGFYWTEGTRGLGWAVDAIPTLKGGSTIGIPSPPAIWMPDGRIVTPDIRDAERMQGFEPDWTKPAEEIARATYRWKLVGNAVSVPVAEWLGRVLLGAAGPRPGDRKPLSKLKAWPRAAYGSRGERFGVSISSWPVRCRSTPLAEFLAYEPRLLSLKAVVGFTKRLVNGGLRYPAAFLAALNAHIESYNAPPIWPAATSGRSVTQQPLFT